MSGYDNPAFLITFTNLKIFAFILSFIVLFNAVVPCTLVDNCEQEELVAKCCDNCEQEESGHEEDEKSDCNDCPPFSICSTAYEFNVANNYTTATPVLPYSSNKYYEYSFSLNSEFSASLFQPPRFS